MLKKWEKSLAPYTEIVPTTPQYHILPPQSSNVVYPNPSPKTADGVRSTPLFSGKRLYDGVSYTKVTATSHSLDYNLRPTEHSE